MKSTPHPQADILRAIADGETVQMAVGPDHIWHDCGNPIRALLYSDSKLRIKPATITINDHEFPEPVREPLREGAQYWRVSLGLNPPFYCCIWRNNETDMHWLHRGLIQLTPEGAFAQEKAMLSIVARKETT